MVKPLQLQYMDKFSQADYRAIYRLALAYLHEKRHMGEAAVAQSWLEASLHYMLKKNLLMPISSNEE